MNYTFIMQPKINGLCLLLEVIFRVDLLLMVRFFLIIIRDVPGVEMHVLFGKVLLSEKPKNRILVCVYPLPPVSTTVLHCSKLLGPGSNVYISIFGPLLHLVRFLCISGIFPT